jgi:folate-dependent phosphoribosylglycinamide formyltransferase PurN
MPKNEKKLRVYITVTEEPLFLNPFLKELIERDSSEIIGVGIVSGSLVSGKSLSKKLDYLLSIAIISGPIELVRRTSKLLLFKLFRKINHKNNPLSVYSTAEKYDIPVKFVDNINSPEFKEYLELLKPDIIINQAQAILKEDFISIPSIGCLNRHAALLPKYRGRIAPFWAFLNQEKESGVSIHFIDEKIDNGPIVVQKKVPIERFDTFNSLVKKIFNIVPDSFLESLDIIREGNYENTLISNDASKATYYTSPTLKDALKYRKLVIRRWVLGE